ncbi:amino acid permease [Endozoicomonas numazuensis]|uniref:Amino acid permease/ SLC12A domain-containing protein n=1 Tax=Endozoicomonas numazuensis TaxID=1137799 RepID=A0A081NLY8_9GAMM|nr:amino acid permease [Endozoicomonas numazuensis]KEQ19461.1 hypothetical protein GZ78_05860 [Endozoicomonas numazuensis]
MARAAAEKGELAALLARSNHNEAPVGANCISGFLATLIVAIYALTTSSSDELFWEVFSFSVLIMMLPYIPMFLAFLKLRATEPQQPRPFHIPGPVWFLYLLTGCGILFLLWAMSILLMPNGRLDDLLRPAGLMTLTGSLIMMLIIESLLRGNFQSRTNT